MKLHTLPFQMTFTKEILTNYHSEKFGIFKNCNLYIVSDKNEVVGKCIISEKVAFLTSSDSRMRIEISNPYFQPAEYKTIDLNSDLQIGYYIMPGWTIGWKEMGTLNFKHEKYCCDRQKSDIRKNLFKKPTVDHYKLKMYNHHTEIVYKINVETDLVEAANSEFSNATGTISANSNDMPLILAGLFFMERMLNIIDSNLG